MFAGDPRGQEKKQTGRAGATARHASERLVADRSRSLTIGRRPPVRARRSESREIRHPPSLHPRRHTRSDPREPLCACVSAGITRRWNLREREIHRFDRRRAPTPPAGTRVPSWTPRGTFLTVKGGSLGAGSAHRYDSNRNAPPVPND